MGFDAPGGGNEHIFWCLGDKAVVAEVPARSLYEGRYYCGVFLRGFKQSYACVVLLIHLCQGGAFYHLQLMQFERFDRQGRYTVGVFQIVLLSLAGQA